ncbi:UNVERIFIED_CONTAM: hypothetical protein GTU68_024189 [Idotea baltica]|nr:hypothetical protein [Idotea baltica]
MEASSFKPVGKKKVRKPRKRATIQKQENPKEKETVTAWWGKKDQNAVINKEDELTSITLKFTTKQQQYAIPQAPVAVKENVEADQLNAIVESFLEKAGMVDDIPHFEFMIEGKLLEMTLGEHLKLVGKSFESTVEVEFLERYPPPTPKDNLEHDDWVSAVMSNGQWLVTGCYDNTVQLWEVGGMKMGRGKEGHKLTIPAHKAPVKAVAWIRSEGVVKTFASCSIDQTTLVWDWDSKKNSVECVYECRGHTQSVECLGVEKDGKKFATGSWDNSLKIWDADSKFSSQPAAETEPNQKKTKRTKDQRLKTPLMTFAGHSESVSGVDWVSSTQLVSCSWDHSIRLWDIEAGGKTSQISGNIAFFCLAYSRTNNALLAGCADRFVRLYDPRATQGSIVRNKFENHRNWVPTVKWSAADSNCFVTGCYDRKVRVWDMRSSKTPLYSILGHTEKVLSVDWSSSKHIASGGADCSALIYET